MDIWNNRRVFLTGHTGFKGGWLAIWLKSLGAQVTGFSLPASLHSIYKAAGLSGQYSETLADIRDLELVRKSAIAADPEVIIHMAAQPLVRASYADPIETYSTNVMGTAHILEAARTCQSLVAVLVITTDKVYESTETDTGYRENDPLGGDDPYSSSKVCAEHVSSSYRKSFFSGPEAPLIATARAGNVIGGGDWGQDRLVPDMLRAMEEDRPVKIRSPNSVRPWQHVLDPLWGYLKLAEQLLAGNSACAGPWNFGPPPTDLQTVSAVADKFATYWGQGASWEHDAASHVKETAILVLDPRKSVTELNWQPLLNLDESIRYTVDWHKSHQAGADALTLSLEQIESYTARLR